MADSTIVFITGASRGIGKALSQAYLSRPNTTVIGSVRDKTSANTEELKQSFKANGSRLILVKIESASPADPFEAVKELEAAGVEHVDVAIANAGGSGSRVPVPLASVSVDDVTETFQVNTLGPLLLLQALTPLLQKSKKPKWVSITSAVGSIGGMATFGAHVAPAYGIAKVGLNWVTQYAQMINSQW